MTRVLAFGTFDGIHDGHRAMLKEAKSKGEHLTVAVADDRVVNMLKGKHPSHQQAQRILLVEAEGVADAVIAGDDQISTWKILERAKPDVVALGYDQIQLKDDLERHFKSLAKKPTIVLLSPYEPETHHNSKLRK